MIKERMSLMEVIGAMDERQLVLPLFQRPFIWSEEQVCDLFDSLFQGYPLGGNLLLLEKPPTDLKNRLQCCFFVAHNDRESLQRRRAESQILEQIQPSAHLVLDGQQRLFAFYIGIRGSFIRESQERAQLHFDLYPFLKSAERELSLNHHQFAFYTQTELEAKQKQIAEDWQSHFSEANEASEACDPSAFLLPIAQVGNWGRDRRTAKSEIRRFLAPLSGLVPKSSYDELEDLLDELHDRLWVNFPITCSFVAPQNSYDLLEIFSRLNQGSSFQARDLQYAIRIIFPKHVEVHTFSRHLEVVQSHASQSQAEQSLQAQLLQQEQDTHVEAQEVKKAGLEGSTRNSENLLNGKQSDKRQTVSRNANAELFSEEYEKYEAVYEKLLLFAEELKLDLGFLYHCYLFCETGQVEEIVANIRKREGPIALRNNAEQLMHFAEVAETLRDAIDSCNFIVRQWFDGNLSNDYVLLPVLYYFYKQVMEYMDPLNELQNADLSRIVRWIALNEISQSVFRGGLQQLIKLLPVLHKSISEALGKTLEHFPLQELQQSIDDAFMPERSLAISDEEIQNLLDNTKIKHRACKPLIALLYSHPQRIALMQSYEEREIDFIQPQKLLTRRMLKSYDLTDEEVEKFFALRESILNLQWLPKRLHTEKGDIPLRQWLSNSQQLQLLGEQNHFQRKELIINFMRFHHIKAEDGIYALNMFGRFLDERKALLFRVLKHYSQDFSDWDLEPLAPKLEYPAF